MAVQKRPAGPAFPFGNSIKSCLGQKTRIAALLTSLELILTTVKGSIPYNPNLGSSVPLLIFDPLDETTMNLLFYYIVHDVENQDPRIKIASVFLDHPREHTIVARVLFYDRNEQERSPHQANISFERE